jgi:hypothetical protein
VTNRDSDGDGGLFCLVEGAASGFQQFRHLVTDGRDLQSSPAAERKVILMRPLEGVRSCIAMPDHAPVPQPLFDFAATAARKGQ